MQDASYSFTPTANDPDGDSLTFGITGMPSWATFDASTGQVSGTPGPGDVGSYTNIAITVSDGQATVSLSGFAITVVATATGSATLSWTPPTQYTDGSPLTVDHYNVYWGASLNSYVNSKTEPAGVTTSIVDQLTSGTWYFVVTATDSAGIESQLSNVASKDIP